MLRSPDRMKKGGELTGHFHISVNDTKKGTGGKRGGLSGRRRCPVPASVINGSAITYSPTLFPAQYHRRRGA